MKHSDEKIILDKKNILIDFFDTLVHRRMSPNDIKRKWAKEAARKMNYIVAAQDIYMSRIAAEHDLEKNNGYSYDYKMLIEAMFCRLFDAGLCKRSDFPEYEELMNMEIDIESNELYVDSKIESLLLFCSKNNKKMIIISDYHMPNRVLYRYINKLGINHYFYAIYVSCDCKASKYAGDLYRHVLSDISALSSDCVMIGDNKISDIKKSNENGIYGIHKKYTPLFSDNSKLVYKNYLLSFQENDNYSGFCFSISLFIERLYRELKKRGAEKVFFLSREGEFLKKIFDLYLDILEDHTIKSKYLYVSRQSTFVPSLNENIEKELFENLFRQFDKISIDSFLKNIGFDESVIEILNQSIKLDFKTAIDNFSRSEEFKTLKKSKEFVMYYRTIVLQQRKLFNEYLKQEGYDYSSMLFIVDVGWKGTIQDNISKFMKNQQPIEGLYIGYGDLIYGERHEKSRKKGLLFSIVPYETIATKYWTIDAGLFEKILYASHPSTSGYLRNGGIVAPVFKYYEEEKGIYEIILPVQSLIYEKCRSIFLKFHISKYVLEDFSMEVLELHLKTVLTMNYQKIQFRKLIEESHFENFGTFNTVAVGRTSEQFSPQNNVKYFLRRLKQLTNPEFFIRNCYHLCNIHSKFFWYLYSKLIISKAKKDIRSILIDD